MAKELKNQTHFILEEEREVYADVSLDHNVVMSNELARSAQDLSINEYKLTRLFFKQIRPYDDRFMEYKVTIKDLTKIFGLKDSSYLYKQIYYITKRLQTRAIEVLKRNGSGFERHVIFPSIEYDSSTGLITGSINEKLAPHLLELKKAFTKIPFRSLMSFNSVYTGRLFELVVSDIIGELENAATEVLYCKISVDEMRFSLVLDKPPSDDNAIYRKNTPPTKEEVEKAWTHIYPNPADMKAKILDPSCDEISEKTEYSIDCQAYREGKKVVGFEFVLQDTYKKFKNGGLMSLGELKKLQTKGILASPLSIDEIKELQNKGVFPAKLNSNDSIAIFKKGIISCSLTVQEFEKLQELNVIPKKISENMMKKLCKVVSVE